MKKSESNSTAPRLSVARDDASTHPAPRWTQRIDGTEHMPPFLMSLASPSNHWLFLSSLGPLTAGRTSVEHALFPYRTVDRLHDAVRRVGGRTLVRPSGGEIWEPFGRAAARGVTRSIERSAYGTSVTLIERHLTLDLEARQTWTTSHDHGVLRFFELVNVGADARELTVLDGVLDVLPASVDVGMQQTLSSLVDAYRMTEFVGGVAVFGMGSIPVDRPEPCEALLANTVWCTHPGKTLLSERQFAAFRAGRALTEEAGARGIRCSFLVERQAALAPGETFEHGFAMDVDQAADDVERTIAWRAETEEPLAALRASAERSEADLVRILADADALQRTGDAAEDARHYANTLYNVMRGGIPLAPPTESPEGAGPDARRHALETLPLAFSRRHGDPSRPWNRFHIDVRDDEGRLRSGYEGNWRDIFQNWEALGVSYPAYLLSFIARFLNASTADGYNPYRITHRGVDWEVHDPDDPWSFIGYWGDHQIVYLTRLVERHRERFPGELESLVGDDIFVHVDVPYRIRGFDAICADPRATVDFDDERAARIAVREKLQGEDGKLLHDASDQLVRATLEEKLLVPILAKLTNLVPGAGVWMNTQRPEWNDANNALVGAGASIVTACALLRHVEVVAEILADRELRVTERAARLIRDVARELASPPTGPDAASERWRVTEALGRAGERHREAVYSGEGLTGTTLPAQEAAELLGSARAWLAATIDSNRRDDGLFHAYNLIQLNQGHDIEIRRLPLMLEGQVAALASGLVDPPGVVALLDALRTSALYVADRRSYLLYPDRERPSLLDRGLLPSGAIDALPWLLDLVGRGDRSILRPGASGQLRFAPAIRNARALEAALERLPVPVQDEDRDVLLTLYEGSFDHAAFTGRSSTFFGYEGLGCIYWHMVSKLGLTVLELLQRAADDGAAPSVLERLAEQYADIRAGLGTQKSPAEYGAFPSEPYSHTPADGNARQPGMTGQVKEDLLARMAELGVRGVAGRVRLDGPTPIPLEPASRSGAVEFTACGVPFELRDGPNASITVEFADPARVETYEGGALPTAVSRAIWRRDGSVLGVRASRPRARG